MYVPKFWGYEGRCMAGGPMFRFIILKIWLVISFYHQNLSELIKLYYLCWHWSCVYLVIGDQRVCSKEWCQYCTCIISCIEIPIVPFQYTTYYKQMTKTKIKEVQLTKCMIRLESTFKLLKMFFIKKYFWVLKAVKYILHEEPVICFLWNMLQVFFMINLHFY